MPHVEMESTRSLLAHGTAHPIWGWEIALYLFLGGLAAGLTIAVAARVLWGGREHVTEGMRVGLVLAPVLVSLGMAALFLDLGFKAHVYRFYTTFQLGAPMSWGAWILLFVYPAQLLLIAALPPARLAGDLRTKARGVARVAAWAQRKLRTIAHVAIGAGAALGVYTGILLATTVARPLWSSSVLGPLFLVSGLSTGVALLMLLETDHAARALLAKLDIGLVAIELAFLALWLIALATQGPLYRNAAGLLLWGPFAPAFLGVVVFGGLLVPGLLELLGLAGKAQDSRLVPVLVLLGGLILRFVVVQAGQAGGFVPV